MTAITISRQQAHDAGACVDDTRRVLDHLRERDGRIPRMDQRISIRDVADVLGVDGVVWCIGATRRHDALLRRFACLCARRALRRADVRDAAPWRAVRVAWWDAHGWASADELRSARAAAGDAARAATWDAARDAAGDAARDAAGDAARAAAWAAQSAAWDAARAAARSAARAAARDAAWAAARAAERAARDAAQSAAWNAARDAERAWQGARLIDIVRREARVVAA